MSASVFDSGVSVTFDDASHRRFTEVSGDRNEIHVDPVAARRSMPGAVVVHGAHVALAALEALGSSRKGRIERVQAIFRKPVFPGDEVRIVAREEGERNVNVVVSAHATSLASLDVELSADSVALKDSRSAVPLGETPVQLSIEEIEGMSGVVVVPDDSGSIPELFPGLSESMGAVYVAQLMAVSRLIGMDCPGRYSMLSGFDLATTPQGSPGEIAWAVVRADRRVGAVRIELSGGLLSGHVDSFVRPPPVEQPDYTRLTPLIAPSAFAGQRALIVGGSRGLGALTAKLLAAGGADVVITWHQGREDAERLVAEIVENGGIARLVQMDASSPAPVIRELRDGGWAPTHVYHYASPRIFARRTRPFDEELLSTFMSIYVTAFARIIDALDEGNQSVVAFYPSTVAIDDPIDALLEYSIAKAAGEQTARALAAGREWLEVRVERLPRVPTDQTATLLPVDEADPVELLVGLLSEIA